MTRVDDVVVEGRRLEAVAEAFVEAVSAPARTRGLARWESLVCIGVVNFRPEAAHLVIDRLSQVASDLGIALGEPGCDPNLVIVGTTDGPGTAKALVDRHRQHFFRFGSTRANAGTTALDVFQTSDAAVRWWHVSMPVNVYTGRPAIALGGGRLGDIPCYQRMAGAEYRGCNGISDRLMRLIVIVDVDDLPSVTYPQLADYLTMIGLAQIDPGGDWADHDTILNAMADPKAVSGLTEWDMVYLDALYSGENQRLDADEQAGRMVQRLR